MEISIDEQARSLLDQLEKEDAAREKAKTYKPIPKQSPYDYAISLARRFNQELLMGLGDEYSAAANATLNRIFRGGDKSWKDRYDEALPRERGLQKEFDQSNPTASLIAGLAGAAAPAAATIGVGMGPAAVKIGQNFGPNVAQRLARPKLRHRVAGGAAAGGGYGGAYGFGTGEGDATNRVINAAMLAPFGAAVGGAVPVAGTLGRPALAALQKQRAANRMGVDKRAIDPIQRALQQHVKDPQGEVPAMPAGAMAADLGPSTRSLLKESLDKTGRLGDPGRRALDKRADEAGMNISKALDDEISVPEGPGAITARLEAEYGPAQKAAYDKAYDTPVNYKSDSGWAIQEYMDQIPRAERGSVIREARNLMQSENVPMMTAGGVKGRQFFGTVNDDGTYVIHRMPDMMELDYVTRIINEKVKDGVNWKGRGPQRISKGIRSEMKKQSPEYAEALRMGELRSTATEAAELGAKAQTTGMTRDQMQAEIRSLKKQHEGLDDWIDDHMLRGFRYRMDETVSRAKDPLMPDVTLSGYSPRGAMRDPKTTREIKDLSSVVNKDKIEALVGKERAGRLSETVDAATDALKTRETMNENYMRASREALKEGEFMDTVTDVTSGGLKGKIKAAGKMFEGRTPGHKTAAATVEALTKPANNDVLTQILRLGPKSERAMKEAKRLEQTVGGVGLPAMLFAGRSHNRAELEKEKQELAKKRGLGKYTDAAKKAGELTDEALLELMRAVQ